MNKELDSFQKTIGYTFNNIHLLENALTHSSYINENKERESEIEDNERLEFFGDAIIEFYVSEYLYLHHKDVPEGDLTRMRASLVCEQSLAECSRQINLGEYLRMGKGEELSGGRDRASIISDAFEAVTASIYLDSGRTAAEEFILENLIRKMEHRTIFYDAKTRLQEIVQQSGSHLLKYEVISEDGPSHKKVFVTAVYLDDTEIGRGSGSSKKNAQQEAAMAAIKKITNR